MLIEFTTRAFIRSLGLPDALLNNMFLEPTPGGPGQTARFSRPGLVSNYQVGTGPNRGLFAKLGIFGSDIFTASGPQIYRGSTLVGTVTGQDLVRSATSKDQRVFVADSNAYLYQGSTFSQINNPNVPACVDVVNFGDRFIYLQSGSGRYYYSLPNDAANVDGLAFENAELKPDNNVGALVVGELLYIFGTDSTEPTYATGDLNTPFQRAAGRSFERGACSRDAIKLVDNTAFWVGEDRVVYRAASVPQRISTHSIEAMLRTVAAPSNINALAMTFEGHPWYVLNIPAQATMVYDVSTGEWDSWSSFNRIVFRGKSSLDLNGVNYIGDDTTSDIWTLTRGAYQDGSVPLVREATAFVAVEGNRPRCDSLTLTCARGVGLSGAKTPIIEMRFSDDMGMSWGHWRPQSAGLIGDFDQRVSWSRLGRMRQPGRLFHFRCSDPVIASFANLSINGGRA